MLKTKKELARLTEKGCLVNILVCDDNVDAIKKIATVIRNSAANKGMSVEISEINQADRLVDASLKAYDIAFLDVDMGTVNGIDVARRLRKERKDAVIVFITNFIEYAPAGYEVQAFRYLLKSEIEQRLPSIFGLAVEEFQKNHRVVSFSINSENIDVPISNVLYLESQQRLILMHLVGETRDPYRFYANMGQMSDKLEPLGFLRIHKSFLVNMEYIELFQYGKVCLKGGAILSSSEKNHQVLKKRYLLWRGENRWNIV